MLLFNHTSIRKEHLTFSSTQEKWIRIQRKGKLTIHSYSFQLDKKPIHFLVSFIIKQKRSSYLIIKCSTTNLGLLPSEMQDEQQQNLFCKYQQNDQSKFENRIHCLWMSQSLHYGWIIKHLFPADYISASSLFTLGRVSHLYQKETTDNSRYRYILFFYFKTASRNTK